MRSEKRIIDLIIGQCDRVVTLRDVYLIGSALQHITSTYHHKEGKPNPFIDCLLIQFFDTLIKTKTDAPPLIAAHFAHALEQLYHDFETQTEASQK